MMFALETLLPLNKITEKSPLHQLKDAKLRDASASTQQAQVYFDSETGFRSTSVYHPKDLGSNVRLRSPAIIMDETQTIVINPHVVVHVLTHAYLSTWRPRLDKPRIRQWLALFVCRFSVIDLCLLLSRWAVLFRRLLC